MKTSLLIKFKLLNLFNLIKFPLTFIYKIYNQTYILLLLFFFYCEES